MKGIGVTNIFKKNPSQIVASAPCFGEHNREVLKDFGYTDEGDRRALQEGRARDLDAGGHRPYQELR